MLRTRASILKLEKRSPIVVSFDVLGPIIYTAWGGSIARSMPSTAELKRYEVRIIE